MIMATKQGAKQAREVGELMAAAEQLAGEQERRKQSAEQVTEVVAHLYRQLEEFSRIAAETGRNGSENGAGPAEEAVTPPPASPGAAR